LRNRLAGAGVAVLTFNYPYIEEGKRRPDPPARLLECHRAALNRLRAERGDAVVLAGRSMGGRMGTLLAAEGEAVEGLVLFAYPLHPPGKPDRLRVEHLGGIGAPMLFLSGSRDSFARVELIDEHLRSLPGATVELLDEADHSFRVPKRSPRTYEEVLDEAVRRTVEWMDEYLSR
jgi:predicted alpha/beta-hydrolase family hydrolase